MEFTLVAPLFLLIFIGIAESGIIFYEYMTLTNAVSAGASQLASSAGVDGTPYTDAVTMITNSTTLAPLTITASINGTACASDASCNALVTGNTNQYVTVQATYSCAAMNIVFNLFPACKLGATETERVQ